MIEKGYTAYPDANILDVFKGVVYLLKKRLEEHRQLEQRWVADGLSILWDTHMICTIELLQFTTNRTTKLPCPLARIAMSSKITPLSITATALMKEGGGG
uniref:Uncharacterized protein n=1 Tax=Cryptococcus bacillisporus CA1280 TaxID=1296109 RepID=A0A0D0VCD3_CRYGA|nr:hypothetical protein I312_06686 [Cryptococcus bacillisporus CA1280]